MRYALCLLFIAACDNRPSGTPLAITRDSAGITIVENPDPSMVDSMLWIVDTTAAVKIGSVGGPDPLMFTQIVGVTRQRDGRIVVADQQTNQIRFFSSTGAHDTTVGRRGQGPGEFNAMDAMYAYPGDSILVEDNEGSAFVLLDPRGRHVRRFGLSVERPDQMAGWTSTAVRGLFGDGTFLMTDYMSVCNHTRTSGGVCDDSSRFFRATPTKRVTDYGPLVESRGERKIMSGGPNIVMRQFLPSPVWAVSGDRFIYGDPGSFEIRVYSTAGTLERIIRAALPRQRFPTNTPLPTFLGSEPATAAERPLWAARKAAYEGATRPEFVPAFQSLIVDRVGNLWVKERINYWENPPRERWWVFDSTGVLRRSLRLPKLTIVSQSYLRPRTGEIGNDYIIGVATDGDGVQSVVMMPLVKRGS